MKLENPMCSQVWDTPLFSPLPSPSQFNQMRNTILSVAALLSLALPGVAQDVKPVEVPDQVQIESGRMTMLTVSTQGKVIRWLNPNKSLDLLEFEEGRKVVVSSPLDGEYPIYVYTAIDGVPTVAVRCLVKVGKATPPGPNPPGPNPPSPVVPLFKEVKEAFDKDITQFDLKVKAMADLADLYSRASTEAVGDPSVTTVAEFSQAVNRLAAGKPVSSLVDLRTLVARKFEEALGKDGKAPFNDERKKASSDLFKQFSAAILEVIK